MQRREFLALAGTALAARAATALAGTPGLSAVGADAARFHADRRYARTPFGEIAYVARGSGAAALFLHGFPLNGFQWRGAIDRLAPYRRCIAPDFLGLGHTRVADGQPVGPDAQVAMLAALLDALGVATVDVIANDSGGAVAQWFAVRHRERVRTLLLTNCDVEIDSPPAAMRPVLELAKAGRFADEWLGRWRADTRLARSAEGIGGMCYADAAQPTDEAIEAYFAPLLATPRRKALVHAYALALDPNPLAGLAPRLRQCTVPARIVWGMGDTIFAPADADYLDRTLPISFGVRRLPESKLFWPEERPDIVANEARTLWAQAASVDGDAMPDTTTEA